MEQSSAPPMYDGTDFVEQAPPATEEQALLAETKDETHVQIQANHYFAEEKSFFGCTRSPHLRAFIFNAAYWCAWIFFIVAVSMNYGMKPPPQDMNNIFTASWIALLVMFIIYTIEALACATSRYLMSMQDIVTYINRLRDVPPNIWFWCECYHYETRTRLVTEHYTEHVNGRAESRTRTRVETYTEKVVTHTEQESFRYARFSDDSGVVHNDILRHNATRIDFTKGWKAGSQQTQQFYESQKYAFQSRNRNRDTHFTFNEGMSFAGFQEKMLAIVDLKKKSIFMNWLAYAIIAIVFMQSWLYRLWMEKSSVKARYHFNKTVFVEPH